jgi:hypothetical protein
MIPARTNESDGEPGPSALAWMQRSQRGATPAVVSTVASVSRPHRLQIIVTGLRGHAEPLPVKPTLSLRHSRGVVKRENKLLGQLGARRLDDSQTPKQPRKVGARVSLCLFNLVVVLVL